MKTLNQQFQAHRGRAKISLTPLIDVVFILLVFFMLASNFQQERNIELTTPASGAGKTSLAVQEHTVRVEIMGQNEFLIDGKTSDLARLENVFSDSSKPKFIVKAGPNSIVQDVVTFMDLAARHKVQNIQLSPNMTGN